MLHGIGGLGLRILMGDWTVPPPVKVAGMLTRGAVEVVGNQNLELLALDEELSLSGRVL